MLGPWAELEPEEGDLDRNWKRRAVVEDDEEEGWRWEEDDREETVEQESTESRESGCLWRARRRWLFPSDFLGRVVASAGPLSNRDRD